MDNIVISRLSTYLTDGVQWTKDLLAEDIRAAVKLIENHEELDMLQLAQIQELKERIAELERENKQLRTQNPSKAAAINRNKAIRVENEALHAQLVGAQAIKRAQDQE